MPETWRQCPSCFEWRKDVAKKMGMPQPCNACSGHEFGKCDCCGYKPKALKPPQKGGFDPLAEFHKRM